MFEGRKRGDDHFVFKCHNDSCEPFAVRFRKPQGACGLANSKREQKEIIGNFGSSGKASDEEAANLDILEGRIV